MNENKIKKILLNETCDALNSVDNKINILFNLKKKNTFFTFRKRIMILTSIFLLLVTTLYLDFEVYAQTTIYIDINPSFELIIDNNENVKKLNLKNEDALTNFYNIQFEGKSIEEVFYLIINTAIEKNFLDTNSTDNAILLGGYNKNFNKLNRIINKITEKLERSIAKNGLASEIIVEKATKKEVKIKNLNISPSKLKLMNSIIKLDNSYQIESLQDLSITELNIIYKGLKDIQKENKNNSKKKTIEK